MAAATSRAQFKKDWAMLCIGELNVPSALRQPQCRYSVMAHLGNWLFLNLAQSCRIPHAYVDAVGKQGLDLLTDAQDGSLTLPDKYFAAVLAALQAVLDNDL